MTDIHELAAIWVNVFNSPPWNDNWDIESSTERLNIQISNPYFIGFKIKENGITAGFIIARIIGLPNGKGIFIDDLCVSIESQKKGYGRALINEIENIAKEMNIKMIIATTAKQMPSYLFYQNIGFIDNQSTIGLYKMVL